MTNPEAVVAVSEPCLCLNIKCPPMLTLRMLSKLVVLFWETVGTLGGDTYSDKVGHLGCLWMMSWAFNPLFSLPPICQEETDIAHVLPLWCVHGLNPLKLWAQTIPFFYLVFLRPMSQYIKIQLVTITTMWAQGISWETHPHRNRNLSYVLP